MNSNMKKITSGIVMLALLVTVPFAIQSCTDGKAGGNVIPKSTEPVPVTVMKLQKTMDHAVIRVSGQLTTDDETILGFKTGGIIKAVFVKEGDRVKKGQLLAELDLTEINALVSQARHGYEKANRDLNRARNLFKDSVATLEQLQNAETGLAMAKEQLEAATFNLSFSEIHAPANGYVLRKFANAGQVVGIGDPILLTNGAGAGNWILKAGVSDRQWAALRKNEEAIVKIDAFPGQEFRGVVLRKSESADSRTGTFTLEVAIASREKFASGMFGTAEIITGEMQTSWRVPYESVLDANGNEGYVFVTNDLKTATRKQVTIQSFDGEAIRIAQGLEDGDVLILSGSAYLSDQSPITIIK
jgi:RND family efflux transporter MFP subunit